LLFLSNLFDFISPYCLTALIDYLNAPTNLALGVQLTILLVLAQLLSSATLNMSFYLTMRIGLQVRGTVSALLLRKSLYLDSSMRSTFPAARLYAMLSGDIDALEWVCWYLHTLWVAPLRVVAVLVLLYKLLGVSSLPGAGLMLLCVPLQSCMARKLAELGRKVSVCSDARVRLIRELFSAINFVKMCTWEARFLGAISRAREEELAQLRPLAYLKAANVFLLYSLPVFVSVSTFAWLSLIEGKDLTPSLAFTSLTLFNMLAFPLQQLPQAL